jgi:hypothetical protein
LLEAFQQKLKAALVEHVGRRCRPRVVRTVIGAFTAGPRSAAKSSVDLDPRSGWTLRHPTIMRKDYPAIVDAVHKTAAIDQQRVG